MAGASNKIGKSLFWRETKLFPIFWRAPQTKSGKVYFDFFRFSGKR
jgi:hypothetical protein